MSIARCYESAKLVALAANPNDVAAIGPELAQRLFLTSPFYWDLNDKTRAFSRRVMDRMPQRQPPNAVQAGCYSGTVHYREAVAALGVAAAKADGTAVVACMKDLAIDDDAFGSGAVRTDGRAIFPVHLFQAKAPGDIRREIDTLRLVATTPKEPLASTAPCWSIRPGGTSRSGSSCPPTSPSCRYPPSARS